MSDTEIIDEFLGAEKRWVKVLTDARSAHEHTLGKTLTPLRWLPEKGCGRFGWLGYYWESPPFWFGFGRQDKQWSPLIECDVRRCDPSFVLQLERYVPSTWRHIDRLAGRYWRLWAPADVSVDRDQTAWLIERSHELHEFTVAS